MLPLDRAEIAKVFQRYPVLVAYLFGSQALGSTTARSDVDIAVLLAAETPRPGEVQCDLISDLMLTLGRNDIDLAVLNTAPPLLKQRVISNGVVLFSANEQARVRFEVATRREYLDTTKLRELQNRHLVERYS